jgi:hypothetical protein
MISQFKSKVGMLAKKFGRFGKQKTFKMKAQDALAKGKKFAKKNKLPLAVGGAFVTGGLAVSSLKSQKLSKSDPNYIALKKAGFIK